MRLSREVWVSVAVCVLCLQQWCVDSLSSPVEDRAGKVRKASSHSHWEHLVRKTTRLALHNSANLQDDDTAHILDVQDYYRTQLSQGWDNHASPEDRATIQGNLATIQSLSPPATEHGSSSHTKPIKGRYIVMLQSGTDDSTLDKTMAMLRKANRLSKERVRATDMSPLRHVGKGFTATLNKKAVELVSVWLSSE